MRKHARTSRAMAGFSMIEALVALVVISVGMLGIAGLYVSSLQADRSANFRIQAVNLAEEMADRIRSNRAGREHYNLAAGGSTTAHACVSVTCTSADIAENDLDVWVKAISNSTNGALRGLTNVSGSVTYLDNTFPIPNRYTITITWREAGSDVDSSYTMVMEL